MTVYVDDMRAKLGRMTMCHMLADTTEELLAMADQLGVKRKWLQYPGQVKEHFDICLSKRAKAVQLGAVEIDSEKVVAIIRARRAKLLEAREPEKACWQVHLPGRRPFSMVGGAMTHEEALAAACLIWPEAAVS